MCIHSDVTGWSDYMLAAVFITQFKCRLLM